MRFENIRYFCFWQYINYSLSQDIKTFMQHVWTIFNKKKTHIHVPVKFVQEKYPNHLRLHIVIFHSEKITSTKTDFLQRYIIMENVYISPPFGNHAEYLAQFYSVIIGVLWFLSQCKIPVDFFFNFKPFFETWQARRGV